MCFQYNDPLTLVFFESFFVCLIKFVAFVFFRGFTKFNRADFTKLRAEKRVVPDGVNAKVSQLCINL